MRFFKLIGAAAYNYYDNNVLKTIKPGGVLPCKTNGFAEKLDKTPIFIECNKDGVVARGRLPSPAEKITSRNVFKFVEGKAPKKIS